MNVRIFQKGFNYSQDGPGNRLVYHMQGCNMRCPWCANPEGMSPSGGEDYPVEALLEEANRARSMFFEGGGVTFTGGEPTCQFEALREALSGLREMGIGTALETNASHPRLPELFPLIDFLMLDFKQPDPVRHRAVTGAGQETVLRNLKRACAEHPHPAIRIPMIHGYNASQADQDGFVRTLAGFAPGRATVEVLRYHEYGRDKWKQLGLPYAVEDGFISDEECARFTGALRGAGIAIIRT